MFLKVDGTFWIQLVNFAIFFSILNVVFLRPVGAAIMKRRAYIDEIHRDFDEYSKKVASSQADADARRSAARRDAEETIAKARVAAEVEAQNLLAGQTSQAQAIIEQSRATVALEVSAAKAREPELSSRLAQTLLERALGGGRT